MAKFAVCFALTGLLIGIAAPAAAQEDGRQPNRSRPRIVVHPRPGQLGPDAKRYCRSWLVQEYRVSGPVIVPRMQCWWQ
jgi:hypothetical protein